MEERQSLKPQGQMKLSVFDAQGNDQSQAIKSVNGKLLPLQTKIHEKNILPISSHCSVQ